MKKIITSVKMVWSVACFVSGVFISLVFVYVCLTAGGLPFIVGAVYLVYFMTEGIDKLSKWSFE